MNDMNGTLRTITPRELYALGIHDVAYVKPVSEDGVAGFAMHAADGTRLGLVNSRELAFAALKQHDLEPVSVH